MAEFMKLSGSDENQFLDFKRKDSIEKIQKTVSAFANSDGGELYVGVADKKETVRLQGFVDQEAANDIIKEVSDLFFKGNEYCIFNFIKIENASETNHVYILLIIVHKTPFIVELKNKDVYRRLNASDRKLSPEECRRLEIEKGIVSYEDYSTTELISQIAQSNAFKKFAQSVVPNAQADSFFQQERLSSDLQARVAAVVLFDDNPQSALAQTAVKIYRYKSLSSEGNRETLDGDPITVEGPAYDLILNSVSMTIKKIEEIPILRSSGLGKIKYPPEAIHEIVCNAILHRDYSLNDYVHIRIFDNRIEIESPGRLAGPVTVKDILKQRFARNKKMVRLINKFPSPPNKDIGEGSNTAFKSMRDLKLGYPEIVEGASSVIVSLKHEPLASAEDIILKYISANGSINNRVARQECSVESDSIIRKTFAKMISAGLIMKKHGTRGKGTKYVASASEK
jgi:ATP-dependent DNA helicase RecG